MNVTIVFSKYGTIGDSWRHDIPFFILPFSLLSFLWSKPADPYFPPTLTKSSSQLSLPWDSPLERAREQALAPDDDLELVSSIVELDCCRPFAIVLHCCHVEPIVVMWHIIVLWHLFVLMLALWHQLLSCDTHCCHVPPTVVMTDTHCCMCHCQVAYSCHVIPLLNIWHPLLSCDSYSYF